MTLYEHVFIARPELSPQRAEALGEEFAQAITSRGGRIETTEYWGLRQLAYPIKKNQKGHYLLLDIEADHEAISEMERLMQRHDDVLRFLTLKVEKLGMRPSIPMQHKDKGWGEDIDAFAPPITKENEMDSKTDSQIQDDPKNPDSPDSIEEEKTA